MMQLTCEKCEDSNSDEIAAVCTTRHATHWDGKHDKTDSDHDNGKCMKRASSHHLVIRYHSG